MYFLDSVVSFSKGKHKHEYDAHLSVCVCVYVHKYGNFDPLSPRKKIPTAKSDSSCCVTPRFWLEVCSPDCVGAGGRAEARW